MEFISQFYPDWDKNFAADLASRFEIPLQKKANKLSTGNRAKLSLISVLAHKPKLLILDEPTSGLDPVVRDEFLDVLFEAVENSVLFLVIYMIIMIWNYNISLAQFVRTDFLKESSELFSGFFFGILFFQYIIYEKEKRLRLIKTLPISLKQIAVERIFFVSKIIFFTIGLLIITGVFTSFSENPIISYFFFFICLAAFCVGGFIYLKDVLASYFNKMERIIAISFFTFNKRKNFLKF